MARSFTGSLKGALRHADKALGLGGQHQSASDSAGCTGCLLVIALAFLVVLIAEYWVPIVVVGGVLCAALVFGLLIVRLTAPGQDTTAIVDVQSDEMAPAAAPAGWFSDPVCQHQYRYWDGAQWTKIVADDGLVTED